MALLPFITDQDFLIEVKKVTDAAAHATSVQDTNLYSNVVDPFSAIFDALRQNITLTDWLLQEKDRQIQKTIQNKLGTFHQGVLGRVDGWEDLGTGAIVDLANSHIGVIAEVKNKHNTTKGNHKKEIYDDLLKVIQTTHKGATGYYVEIIPARKEPYNKPFTPPDNTTHTQRPMREDIRVVDGKSFYALVTGYPNAIDMVYDALPEALGAILDRSPSLAKDQKAFTELFYRAYLR